MATKERNEVQPSSRIDLQNQDSLSFKMKEALDILAYDIDKQYEAQSFYERSNAQLAGNQRKSSLVLQGTNLQDYLVPRTTSLVRPTESHLFSRDQRINSWLKRHLCDPPMPMPGDPVLRLNHTQRRAVAMALSKRCSLIQGVCLQPNCHWMGTDSQAATWHRQDWHNRRDDVSGEHSLAHIRRLDPF